MAGTGILPNSHPLLKPSSSSFISLPLNPPPQFFPYIKPLNFTTTCSQNTTEQTHNNPNNFQQLKINTDVPKKKRKPRPSFHEQIRDKWSVKPISNTRKFPWQLQEQVPISSKMVERTQDKVNNVSSIESSSLFAQVVDESKVEEPMFDYERIVEQKKTVNLLVDTLHSSSFDKNIKFIDRTQVGNTDDNCNYTDDVVDFGGELGRNVIYEETIQSRDNFKEDKITFRRSSFNEERSQSKDNVEEEGIAIGKVKEDSVTLFERKNDAYSRSSLNDKGNSEGYVRESSKERLPWVSESDGKEDEKRKRSNTELADKTIPEYELKRLRNVALRMKERIKVGDAGVTQAIVDEIHENWKIDEVVKLKFEGPPSFHMKRSHEVLESKTGGLVIWRSGSSVVLYRGLTYKLGCVKTYMKEKEENSDDLPTEKPVPDFARLQKTMSPTELAEMNEIDNFLDGLGPRFVDWSGQPPLPVDADLLPGVVPGYRTPFRLLPHGVQRSLKDSETTKIRRQARFMPAHFALGRNRELQGLAAAVVKLWEKSALAKIAIKRGVLNTRNERMAEELKRLTGGTLLSRNKEYIVFYRGNDFMPPPVTESLKERERLTMLQYEEEETRRYGLPLVHSNSKKSRAPLVAGTLAETVAATSRWANQPDSKDIDKMIKDSAVARRASLAKYLQNKLAIANGKLRKAEKALEKVQKYLIPEELPTDLETITDEERLVFRKMGLSMKPYLLLGRRGVFDGTIENMHLHWKFRELVKIVISRKSFPQVKHIAISLEAESGGVLVSIDKTIKGYDVILYRGKNYRRPDRLKPRNLLTRRQALARCIELQRREGLKHHISSLQDQMELVKSELEDLKDGKELDDMTFYEKLDDSAINSDDEMEEDEDEEAYLLTYDDRTGRGIISSK